MSALASLSDASGLAANDAARLAPIRARGRVAIELAPGPHGRTFATRVTETGGYRVRFPRHTGRCEAVLINTGGGMAGGDSVAFDIETEAGASAFVTTPSAERVYGSAGGTTQVRVSLSLSANSSLAWMPQETILYSRSRLNRSLDVDMDRSARLVASEIIVFGRKAMGERLATGSLADRWRVRRDGRLVFAEAVRLEGEIDMQLARGAVLRGCHVVATLLYLAPDAEEQLDAVRAVLHGLTAASAWSGLLCVRSIGDSVEAVRHSVAAVGRTLLRATMPRVWGDLGSI